MDSLRQYVALTIAGVDPSGGSGVLADMRTFESFGLQATAAITSITFQNESRFLGAVHQDAETVRAQVMSVLGADDVVCAKIGMLPTKEIVTEVARLLTAETLPAPVVDPVLVSSTGVELIEKEAIPVLTETLFPVARLVTPNISEAEFLTGLRITSEDEMRDAALAIRKLGARAVLVKGGHLASDAEWANDLLDDDGAVSVFRERRIPHGELHGSGCILSSAIAAGLGNGMSLQTAVTAAKKYVLQKILDRASRRGTS